MKKFIGALDQGTTSTRFLLFNHSGQIVGAEQKEHRQILPKSGWVEHDPVEIWANTQHVIRAALARAGIQGSELAAIGVTTEASSRAHYYPGAQPMRIKIVAERRTGRLLGAQIVGGEGAGKRIDVLATALWNNMTVEAVGGMDLSYAPPFSPVWDPVLLAAGKAASKI